MLRSPTQRRREWLILILSAAVVFLADQAAKGLILRTLTVGEIITPLPFLEDFFRLTLSYNTGAAFGLLPQLGDIFLIIAVGMTVGVILYYRRIPPGYWAARIALGMVLGGTLGNALDRLRFGYVVDWVVLRLPGVITNVSNFADHAIVIGMAILFIVLWRYEERQKQTTDSPKNPS